MASKTVNIVGSPYKDEEQEDEKFSDFSRQLTRAFADRLYAQTSDTGLMAREPLGRESKKVETMHPAPVTTVVERLLIHADALNEELLKHQEQEHQALTQKRSIYDIGYQQFESTCNRLLATCRNYVNSGWEQVTLVYMTACQLLSELRSNTAPRDGSDITLRERQMERFAGDYIINSQLREIIDNQGGMEHFGTTTLPVADINGTEV